MKEVKIGKQIWMTENLNVDSFINGDPIKEAKTNEEWLQAAENKQPAWCYFENDSVNGKIYGKLYNWFAVNDKRGLAPKGWRIASLEDWEQLNDFLGGDNKAGKKIKNKIGWKENGNGTNSSGFSALPGGNRHKGEFWLYSIGYKGHWWSSTEYNNESAFYWYLDNVADNYDISTDFGYSDSFKGNGYSIRCIRE
jgi:uncharacterized protein (TIGR02145 family)